MPSISWPMKDVTVLRCLVLTEMALSALALLVAFLAEPPPLPPQVQEYLESTSPLLTFLDSQSAASLLVQGVLASAVGIAYLAALIGLLWLKAWARTAYIVVFVVDLALLPFYGPTFSGGLETVVDYLFTTCSGAVLALLLVGPVAEHFRGRPAAGPQPVGT